MATYPAEAPTVAGLSATSRSAAATDKVPGGTLLRINNGGGAPTVVTIVTAGTTEGHAIDNPTVSVTNGTAKYIKIPNSPTYVDPADGLVTIQFSVTTTVTYDVLSYPS